MIPVLYKFDFNLPWAQALLYLVAVGLVIYVASAGWRGAHGPLNAKTGEFEPANQQQKLQRALLFGAIAVVLAGVGLHYALPPTAPLSFGGKNEGIPIHTYGVLLASGFIGAVTLAGELAKREWPGEEGERKRDQVMDLAFWVLIGGIVGSRILFIIVNWDDYSKDLTKIFDLGGGLVFYGGLIGAATVSFFYARKHKIDFLRLSDLALPTVSLGQCLGRLGCFSAGCCWGRPTGPGALFRVRFPGSGVVKNLFGQLSDTPALAFQSQLQPPPNSPQWVVESTGKLFHDQVPGAIRISDWVAQHGTTLPIHPTQLYESVGQLALMFILLSMRSYRRFHGQIAGLWLMGYAILRSTVELFRGDLERGTLNGFLMDHGMLSVAQKVPAEAWYNISTSQFISICMFVGGALILWRQGRQVFFPQAEPAAVSA